MIKSLARRLVKPIFRHNDTGQSIVILALGFIGLLAMVGITTDVSLLFARYTQLRRAVDAASIAAAGEMRQDRSIASANLTARQYIEFHGLDPREVIVDVCYNYATKDPDEEVCTDDQRKIVRVTAQIVSPTVFLRLIGWQDVTLQTSALAETAVLDVVIVMNASESMAAQTTYEDWARVGLGVAYRPPQMEIDDNPHTDTTGQTVFGRMFDVNGDGTRPIPVESVSSFVSPEIFPATGSRWDWWQVWFWEQHLLGVSQEEVSRRIQYVNADGTIAPNYDPPGTNYDDPNNPFYQAHAWVPQDLQNRFGNQNHPRPECRVRFAPPSRNLFLADRAAPGGRNMQEFYRDEPVPNWPRIADDYRWSNFTPAYDFHGCCNAPGAGSTNIDGEVTINDASISGGSFNTLICQPFKQARDATRQFLERIDFERGDRVAFVNFATTAFLVTPAGVEGANHMIESRSLATQVLDRYVGVMAEPNYYAWDDDFGWANPDFPTDLHFARGIIQSGADRGQSRPVYYYALEPGDFDPNYDGYQDYPMISNCRFQTSRLPYPYGRYSMPSNIPGVPGAGTPLAGQPFANVTQPNVFQAPWRSLVSDPNGPNFDISDHSYEFRAQCANSNVGAALREANNALTNPQTARTDGTVRIIIMLGDGAATASDPVRLLGNKPVPADPYAPQINNTLPDATGRQWQVYGQAGDYGAFGLCPYGTPDRPSGGMFDIRFFPYCTDQYPETRHFCRGGSLRPGAPDFGPGFSPNSQDRQYDLNLTFAENVALGNVFDVDVGQYPESIENCDPLYDPDDYARDWADFVTGVSGDFEAAEGSLLPTIFTIGFGLNFDRGDGSCQANISDCLGEELLRYIADVGENWTMNMLYQQDYLHNNFLDGSKPLDEYRQPSPCEPEGGGYDRAGGPVTFLDPGTSCGNYYNAPTQAELQLVFEDIASRMFMRLTG